MTIEQGLLAWLEANTPLDAFWLESPAGKNRTIVYRNISPSMMSGNLSSPGLRRDLISITVYNDEVETGKAIAEKLMSDLHDFHGDLSGFFVQLIEFQSGFDQKLNKEPGMPVYQFNRDFLITY
ncbi:MAG: hypothetical protein MJK10_03810 [Pseudomonadales bacterium]|nr:hypothetical protein [Pseudomonadales bacterium]NRA15197.1 hypothetical protein [Oceanospirillaceae bacterium]